MDSKESIKLATRTESVVDEIKVNPQLLVNVLTLCISSGRMLDQIKKHIFYGKDYNVDDFNVDYQTIISTLQHLSHMRINGSSREMEEEILKNTNSRLLHAIIGTTTESTELCEALYSELTNGTPLDEINLAEEFFDIDWYKFIAFDELGVDPDNVLTAGFQKLKDRYPDKFTSEKAIIRDLNKERQTLETHIKIPGMV